MKLKIRFTEFKEAVAMQILEQEGLPERVEEGRVLIDFGPSVDNSTIWLRGRHDSSNYRVATYTTENPSEKIQEYVSWITEFMEGLGPMPKFPCLCKVWGIGGNRQKTRFVLGGNKFGSFSAVDGLDYVPDDIMQAICDGGASVHWQYAEPLNTIKFSKCDDIYTWEN